MFLSVQAAVSVRGSCRGSWAMERERGGSSQPFAGEGRAEQVSTRGRGVRATPSHGQPLQKGLQSNGSAQRKSDKRVKKGKKGTLSCR